MPIATYLSNKILNHIVGKTSFTMPTVYVGLSTTDPGLDASTLTERSGGAYARKVTSGTTWTTASSSSISNATAITFDQATGSWGSIAYVVLFDALTGGDMLEYKKLVASETVEIGDTLSFSIGDLIITAN